MCSIFPHKWRTHLICTVVEVWWLAEVDGMEDGGNKVSEGPQVVSGNIEGGCKIAEGRYVVGRG